MSETSLKISTSLVGGHIAWIVWTVLAFKFFNKGLLAIIPTFGQQAYGKHFYWHEWQTMARVWTDLNSIKSNVCDHDRQ